MIKIYSYEKCSTCKKALGWLKERGVRVQVIPIVDQPPTVQDLRQMIEHLGELKKLFNTSGKLYREMKIGERLPQMALDEALELLSKNGKLVKRPFLLGDGFGCVGFKEEEWSKRF